MTKEPKRSSTIKYINPKVPHVELPAYSGQRYDTMAPDTLDIQERAALAVHGLTSLTNPDVDYEIYWAVYLDRNPVYMFHSWNDTCWSKYMDALPLLRLTSGSTLNMHVERCWLEVLLHMQGPDGLLYFPKTGKPWWPNQCYGPLPPGEHYTVVYPNGRLLGAMTIYYLLSGEQLWKDAGRRAVDGLTELAVYQGDKAYFEWVQYSPGKQFVKADRSAVTHNFASWFCWTVQGLANYYKMTGYEPAKTLSGKLARWILSDSDHFDSEGRFLPEYPGTSRVHFHGHTMVLLALLDYALITGDTGTVDFVRKSFEFAKDNGNTIVGYFPEWLSGGLSETCEVADMVALALKLSQAGAGDYWDDADRWIRNQFAEAQLLNGDWMDDAVKELPVTPLGPYETSERVPERSVGIFAGLPSANDWWGGRDLAIMACCNGNGTRTIYYIWENILSYTDGKLKVNLLLNRASPWADVESYIPYEGRVDVKVKRACDLSVRIPEWVTPEQTWCQVNGLDRALSWDGRYALVGSVNPKDVMTLTFPIFERTDVVNIEGQDYTLNRKGNDVVNIDPSGKYCPFYQLRGIVMKDNFMVSGDAYTLGDEPGATGKETPGPVTTVETYLHMPTFMLNHEPFTTPVFETYVPETRYFKAFAGAGCKVYSFSTNLGKGFGPPTWIGLDRWDFSELDARAYRVLEGDEDGLIMPRILLSTPDWWQEVHPEELLVLDDGWVVYKQSRTPVTPIGRTFASIASEKWRQDMAYGLRQMIAHIQHSDYADQIFGYMITGLKTEEWYHWSSGAEQLGDYSKPMTIAFRKWLREKYGTVENLRQAWNTSEVDFDSAVIPSKAERFGARTKTFREPKTEMKVIDFYLFHNEIIPETIDYFAKVAKKATGGTKVVGAFYGFMFEFGGDPEFGHNALGKLLESPNIDFVMVTASYGSRQLGSGLDYTRSPAKSVALHNKLWYHDNDTISFLYRKVMERVGIKNIEFEGGRLGATETVQESIWMYRRVAGFTLGNGFFQSFFDLHGGYFSAPQLLEEIKTLNVLFDESKHDDRSSCSEVLIVSDGPSCAYVVHPRSDNGRNWWSELLVQAFIHSQPAFFKMGTPHDSILVDDLALVDMDPYKLIVFLNVYHLTDEQRELIRNQIEKKGKTVLWCYAPGLFNETESSVEAMEKLTGIKIVHSDDETLIAPRIELVDSAHPLSCELKAAGLSVMGPEVKSCKLFSVKDTGAIVLGTLPWNNEVTLAIKNVDGWTSIYTITPVLPAAFYRAIARYAGVHIYNDADDTLYVSKSYLTISVDKAGPRTIQFPYRCNVIDPFTDEKLYENVTQFTKDFRAKEVMLVRYDVRL